MTTPVVDHRTVLDALSQSGSTEPQIAGSLGVPGGDRPLRLILTRLLCGDLVSMQVVDGRWVYRPTRRAAAMADATDETLSAWVSSCAASASSLKGGGVQ